MNSRESSECQGGNTGYAEGRRMVLDFDLNSLPPDENMTLSNPQELQGQGNGYSQGQATNDIEVIDDDEVVVISPRKFAEATKNSRRNNRLVDGPIKDWLLLSDLRHGTLDDQTASNRELFLNFEGSKKTRSTPLCPSPPQADSLIGTPTFTCGICMDQLTEETSTKCGHIFCKKCIDAAIATQRKCPSCRQKLTKRDTIRIYLPKSG